MRSCYRVLGLHQDPFFKVSFEFDTVDEPKVLSRSVGGRDSRARRTRRGGANNILDFDAFQSSLKQDVVSAEFPFEN